MILGFACRVVDGHPIVVGIRLDPDAEGFSLSTVMDHRPVRHASWADKLALVAGEVETLLGQQTVDAVVVKTMEARTPVGAPRLDDAARMRLHLEGVLLMTAQRHAAVIDVLTGQQLGRLVGSDKATLESEAAALVGKKKEVIEAAAAAIGGLALSRQSA